MPSDKPSFITPCSEDEDGNLLFEIPDELLEALGWKEGTVLDISVVGDRLVLREVLPVEDVPEEDPAPRRRKSTTKRGTKDSRPARKPKA